MGLRANYHFISDDELHSLKNLDLENEDFAESVAEVKEEVEISLDLDKMWDVLHFVLTGKDYCDNAMQDNPLSQAIVGDGVATDEEEYIAYINKSSVPAILEALKNFDMQAAMQNFSMQKCKEAEIYPDIWDDEDEAEEIQEDICDCFERLKEFYQQILAVNGNVLISIC